jgi:DNA-binding transcriptional ArsR family regulator
MQGKDTIQRTIVPKLSNVLDLASSDVRLKILYLLHEEGKLCPCDISDILDMTVPQFHSIYESSKMAISLNQTE